MIIGEHTQGVGENKVLNNVSFDFKQGKNQFNYR